MSNIYQSRQILESTQTTSEIFNPGGEFQILLYGIPSGQNPTNHTWFVQIKAKQLPDADANWKNFSSQMFLDTDGRSSATEPGSEGFDYRLKNTHSSAASGVTAYWYETGTKIYKD